MEVPPIVPIDISTPLITDINTILEHNDTSKRSNVEDARSNDRREIFQKIGQQEFEDVVFTPERKQKKPRSKVASRNDNDRMSTSLGGDHLNANETTHSSLMKLSLNDDFILKSDRDLETIQRDVENKEKLLADVLDFDLSKYMTSSRVDNNDDSNVSSRMDTITCITCNVHSTNSNEEQDTNEENENIEQSDYTAGTESGEEDVSYRTELKLLEDLGDCRKALLQSTLHDTPAGNANLVDVRLVSPINRDELEHQFNSTYHCERAYMCVITLSRL